tara:strand:- start:271 stop:882 length:612 start_codon:yes stop_codon:yes gene_type:complete
MKILIEAIPRSGSTALLKALAKIYNCRAITEPWLKATYHETLSQNILEERKVKNVVIKSMASQVPSDGKYEDRLDIHTRFAKQFDIVICLGRKNKKEQVESFVHAIKNNTGPKEWHGKYTFNDNISEEDYIEYGNQYDSHMSDLKLLAKNLDKEIIWYEDLFSGNKTRVNECLKYLPNNISYDNLKKYINPVLKYRVSDKIFI